MSLAQVLLLRIHLARRACFGSIAGWHGKPSLSSHPVRASSEPLAQVGANTGAISQAAIPFGGVGQSGFGREGESLRPWLCLGSGLMRFAGSKYGLAEYQTIKREFRFSPPREGIRADRSVQWLRLVDCEDVQELCRGVVGRAGNEWMLWRTWSRGMRRASRCLV